jgi:hypothetical protein
MEKIYKQTTMNITKTFLKLTSRTYPHGTEGELFPYLYSEIPGLQVDEFGNLFVKVGESDVMFTSHLDTATSANTEVNHVFDKNIIKTDGKSILGADDKAGVTVMMYMIKNNVPGLYYFFLGEEVGCIGSKKVAAVQKENKIEGINKVISFDRRNTKSIITYQSSQRCASDTFGKALADQLNKADSTFEYDIDPTGVLTDSVQFIKIYPECTNISVGYQSEHTFSESQDIEHLKKLAVACTKVNWNDLPVERDPSKVEYRSYGSYGGGWDWEDDYYYGGRNQFDRYNSYGYGRNYGRSWNGNSNFNSYTTKKKENENVWFMDKTYNYVSKVVIDPYTKKYVSVDLCKDRIQFEKVLIDNLLRQLDLNYDSSTWDGFKLYVNYGGNHSSNCDRNDLIEYLPELDYKKLTTDLDDTNFKTFDTEDYNDYCDGFYD